MRNLKNKVQLIGHVGQTPEMTLLEGGKTVIRFSLATNEYYKTGEGEKVQKTQWHNLVAWNKTAELIELLVTKGKEVAIEGKLTSHSYEDKGGVRRYVTEVLVNEFLLLGAKDDQNEKKEIKKVVSKPKREVKNTRTRKIKQEKKAA